MGVVHGHPASVYRVRRTVERERPAVVALEVSDLAVPLFAHYARAGDGPPRTEMEAAIRAGGDARVAGVDGPGAAFVRTLVGHLLARRPHPRTASRVLGLASRAVTAAVRCRVAAFAAVYASLHLDVVAPAVHDCPSDAPADEQARHETRQVTRARAVARMLDRSRAVEVVDTVREESMARRLAALRASGDVVAVVGLAHLDGVCAALDEANEMRS